MKKFSRFAVLSALIGSFLAPIPVSALGLISFGGRVVAITPCISPLGLSIWVRIAPAGAFPTAYIWTPATITKMAGPPSHPGQQILGLADIPYACWNPIKGGLFGLFTFFSYSYGLRMTIVGTGAL